MFPVLADGVVIHIHDIVWRFEYPREWLVDGRAWNEACVVRAFLQNDSRYEILFFADWFIHAHSDAVATDLPGLATASSGSLWLRKNMVHTSPTTSA